MNTRTAAGPKISPNRTTRTYFCTFFLCCTGRPKKTYYPSNRPIPVEDLTCISFEVCNESKSFALVTALPLLQAVATLMILNVHRTAFSPRVWLMLMSSS